MVRIGLMRQTDIFHFTHESNLPKILEEGALLCDRLCQAGNLTTRDIAYSDLKRRRALTPVEAGPGGTLADYVPFYFGTRSPMLYAYKGGYVTGKRENQDAIVYFVTTVEKIASEIGFSHSQMAIQSKSQRPSTTTWRC